MQCQIYRGLAFCIYLINICINGGVMKEKDSALIFEFDFWRSKKQKPETATNITFDIIEYLFFYVAIGFLILSSGSSLVPASRLDIYSIFLKDLMFVGFATSTAIWLLSLSIRKYFKI